MEIYIILLLSLCIIAFGIKNYIYRKKIGVIINEIESSLANSNDALMASRKATEDFKNSFDKIKLERDEALARLAQLESQKAAEKVAKRKKDSKNANEEG